MEKETMISESEQRLREDEEALRYAEVPGFRMVVVRRGAERDEAEGYRRTLRENIAMHKALLQQLTMEYRYV
jgi:hypothetical protein